MREFYRRVKYGGESYVYRKVKGRFFDEEERLFIYEDKVNGVIELIDYCTGITVVCSDTLENAKIKYEKIKDDYIKTRSTLAYATLQMKLYRKAKEDKNYEKIAAKNRVY